jgi:asparagine synthase (glutamine-hydrolysing)
VDDKLAMAHSVEGRVPFLENDLVDTVARIPSEFKLHNGHSKLVLKKAMRGLLPDETLSRRKQGFTPPDQSWYKQSASSYVRDLILSTRAVSRGYFTPSYLERILDDHLNDRRNNRFLIWSLMSFEWWNRLFVDREPLPEDRTGDISDAAEK